MVRWALLQGEMKLPRLASFLWWVRGGWNISAVTIFPALCSRTWDEAARSLINRGSVFVFDLWGRRGLHYLASWRGLEGVPSRLREPLSLSNVSVKQRCSSCVATCAGWEKGTLCVCFVSRRFVPAFSHVWCGLPRILRRKKEGKIYLCVIVCIE